jgi:xanthine/CO dehydrogenase XdhC/CoxF family maturation factor
MLAGLHCAPRMSAALQGHRHVAPAVVTRHHRRQQRPIRCLRPRRNFEAQDGPESAWAALLSPRAREHTIIAKPLCKNAQHYFARSK